uniref:Leucine rich immune protein (Coil-less) n=1 Tax=Anopheles merus TaxID=30066 RepID=A0A182V105_ANOME
MTVQRSRYLLYFVDTAVQSITFMLCTTGNQAKPLSSKVCGADSSLIPVIKYLDYTVHNYSAATFTVQSNDTYVMYFLQKAPLLRYIYLQHNVNVSLLHIEHCSLTGVPKTIRNVPNLLRLAIKSCRIRHLDLNDFVALHSLYSVDLTNNRIVTITELLPASDLVLPINRLYLANNSLTQLNVRALGALTDLHCLVLEGNRIEEVNRPIALPKLEELSLRNNRIKQLNCTGWHLPALKYLFCSGNRLSAAPTEWQSMWRIEVLDLSFNRLHSFRMDDIYLTQLHALNLAANQLTSVTTPQMHFRVPLARLWLAQNRLPVLDISRWDMPNLWELDVAHNRLTELADVFVRFPNLAPMMILRNNQWSCEWLAGVHPTDLRRKNYGCLSTNQTCPAGKLTVADGSWICCW